MRVRARAGVRDGPRAGGPAAPRARGPDLRARGRRLPRGGRPGRVAGIRDYIAAVPIQAGSGTLVGRVGQERQTAQILDAPADPQYTMHRALELGGFCTMLGVPMFEGERVLGVIVLWRETVARRRAHDRARDDVRRPGRDRDPERPDGARARHRHAATSRSSWPSMSHELRTPLNAVIGFRDVLLERLFGELNERQEEYVRYIRDSGRHLLELINEILDLSKVEAGRMELEPAAPLAARPARTGLGALARVAARERLAVTFWKVDPRGGGCRVGGRDEAQAGRRQPADERGQALRLEGRSGPDRRATRAATRPRGHLVRDTVPRHPQTSDQGSDLRSVPARRPARERRGHRARADALQALRRAARRADRARGGRLGRRQHVRLRDPREDDAGSAVVLVIEDNARNLKLVRDVLGPRGLRDAGGGGTARRPCALADLRWERRPDLILMDINLPGHRRVSKRWRVLRADLVHGGDPGRRVHGVRDERGPCSALRGRASYGYLEKPVSMRARSLAQARGAAQPVILVVDDLAAERAAAAARCWSRAATTVASADVGRGGAGAPRRRAASTSSCSTS